MGGAAATLILDCVLEEYDIQQYTTIYLVSVNVCSSNQVVVNET